MSNYMYSRKQVKTILQSLNIDALNQLAIEFGIATIQNKSQLISNLLNRHKLFGGGLDDNIDNNTQKFLELGDPFFLTLLNNLSYRDIIRLRSTNKDINKKLNQPQFEKIINLKKTEYRYYGTFKPDPNMIGYLLGPRGQTLKNIAGSIGDGVLILYNHETKSFDIFARSMSGVNATINALKSKQASIH